ncbi:S24 family peptidase [Sulfuricurvum sp.]|uniref:S24 family peptidase n=1 Tax=Sulfuricurvum sp. TaxID=2025608 RepID=UPI002626BA3E|nr:S24 family peptidase [Sulfuricurvum sp.]MDD4884803.1 S24 family peptidase [Sulfuricurvum sp.]
MNEAKKMLDNWLIEQDLGTYKELAEYLGVAQNTLDVWKQREKIPEKNILKYTQMQSNSKKSMQDKSKEDSVTITYYPDIQAAGGYGAINGSTETHLIPISKNFLTAMFGLTSFNGLDIIRVVGDSMEPYIPNGETILLQRTTHAKNNQIVVARIEDEVYVKRLMKDPLGEWIKLTSENQYYPDIDIKKKDMHKVEIIGVVCGRFRPF